MKKILYLFCLASVLPIFPSTVSYNFSGGRFGDNLFAFTRALWISYKKGIPLSYRGFTYGDKLALSSLHRPLSRKLHQGIPRTPIKNQEDLNRMNSKDNTIYLIPWRTYIPVDWNDEGFKALLKKEIASKHPLPQLNLPADRLFVAVHVRAGSGPDRTIHLRRGFADKKHPTKFPPNSFYVEQLKRLSELLDDQPLYVHIFTDSRTPENFVELFKKEVNKPNIEYGYKRNADVLEDFFNMARFDYFIRPTSSFSAMAEKLSNRKIVIYPQKCIWTGTGVRVEKVTTLINGKYSTV